jgi:hypothetical protein
MRRVLQESVLTGLAAAALVFLAVPFVLKTALLKVSRITAHKPHLLMPHVNVTLPWVIGLTSASLAVALAAFLIALDISLKKRLKSRKAARATANDADVNPMTQGRVTFT